nr:hypothetical protein [Shouchella shacheensis]
MFEVNEGTKVIAYREGGEDGVAIPFDLSRVSLDDDILHEGDVW